MDTMVQLAAGSWPVQGALPGVVARMQRIAGLTPAQLSLADMAFCLRQQLAVPQVLAQVLPQLAAQPFLCAEYYPGDLLRAVWQLDPACWQADAGLQEEASAVFAAAACALRQMQQDFGDLLHAYPD